MTFRPAIVLNFVRHYASHIKFWKPDGVKYGNITYYPKTRDHVDPPFTPSKLLLVRRVKRFWGNPYWEKSILKAIGLQEKGDEIAIVKNTPDMCALLWKVKHLIKITPIKLPDKLPTADDLNGTYLHENGTFYIVPKVDPACYEATEKFEDDPKRLNRDVIKERLRLMWLDGRTIP